MSIGSLDRVIDLESGDAHEFDTALKEASRVGNLVLEYGLAH